MRSTVATPPELKYPLVYKVTAWARVLTVLVALVLGPVWIHLSIYPPYGHGALVLDSFALGSGLPVAAFLVYGIAWALTARITVHADRFEQHKPFVHRVLALNEIAGRRYTTGRAPGYPVIVLKSGSSFSIDKNAYALDERFNQWFVQLPDLQQLEREQERERIRNDPRLGATVEERVAAHAARRLSFGVMGGVLAAVSSALFVFAMIDRDYLVVSLVLNAILPWASLLVMAFYMDQMAGPDSEAFVFFPFVIVVPVLSLGMVAFNSACLIEPRAALVWGWVLGVALWLAGRMLLGMLSRIELRLHGSILPTLAFLPLAWGYASATLALANRTLDAGSPHLVQTTVTGKYAQHGKRTWSYYVRVAGLVSPGSDTSIRVDDDQYEQLRDGDAFCVTVHPGRFGFPWMETVSCSDATRS